MHDHAQRQVLGVDQRVDLATFDLLAGVVADAAIMTAPFSADLIDWLSSTAAVGLASRPLASRASAGLLGPPHFADDRTLCRVGPQSGW